MMTKSKPTNIYEIVNKPNSSTRSILQHIELIKRIQLTISQKLESNLAKHCQVLNFKSNTLVLGADQSNWATRLRYKTSDLLNMLNSEQDLPRIEAIRVITAPQTPLFHTTKKANTSKLSGKASSELNDVALTFSDEQLKQCLLKISKHHQS